MDAAKHNFTATVEALCMLGATRKRSHYVTSLMLAAKKGHAEVVDILASFGAWLTFKDKQGNTALHYAAANNQLAVVQTLFAWSKVPMEWDSYGFLDPDYYKGFKYLLYNAWHPEKEHFGFLDHWNNDHNTALHLAAMYGATEAAITLVKDGASKDLKNNDGRSPLDLAVEKEENDKEKGEPSTGTAEALRKLGCRETYFKGLRDLARGKWWRTTLPCLVRGAPCPTSYRFDWRVCCTGQLVPEGQLQPFVAEKEIRLPQLPCFFSWLMPHVALVGNCQASFQFANGADLKWLDWML